MGAASDPDDRGNVSFLYWLFPAEETGRTAESPSKNGGVAGSHLVKGRAFKGRDVRKECRARELCGLCLYESGEDPAGSIFQRPAEIWADHEGAGSLLLCRTGGRKTGMLFWSWNGQGRKRMEEKEKEMRAAGLFKR